MQQRREDFHLPQVVAEINSIDEVNYELIEIYGKEIFLVQPKVLVFVVV